MAFKTNVATNSGLLSLKGTEVLGEQGYESCDQFMGCLILGTFPKVIWDRAYKVMGDNLLSLGY